MCAEEYSISSSEEGSARSWSKADIGKRGRLGLMCECSEEEEAEYFYSVLPCPYHVQVVSIQFVLHLGAKLERLLNVIKVESFCD